MKHINDIPMWTFLICSFAFVFVVTACSDDDADNINEKETFNQSEENLALDTMRQELLISQLCDEEQLLDGKVVYTPRYGEALHVATPTIYYVGIDTITQARDTWQCIASAVRDSASSQAQINEVDVLNMHLSYSEGGNEAELARIDVECPELADVLTCIVFIPMERWPSNDDIGSPFGFLSVWKDKNYYYLCVKKAQGGDGILLSFDGEWRVNRINFDIQNSKPKSLVIWEESMAHNSAFKALANCISYYPTRYNKALNELVKVAGTNNKTYSKLKALATSDKEVRFNNDYTSKYIKKPLFTYYSGIMNYSKIIDIIDPKTGQRKKKFECWSSPFGWGTGERPVLYEPSRAIFFESDYNNKEGWTCIFVGT